MDSRPTIARASTVRYLLDADHSAPQAQAAGEALGIGEVFWLSQRNSRLGWIGETARPSHPEPAAARTAWQASQPILLPGFIRQELAAYEPAIAQAATLMQAVLEGEDCESLLLDPPYAARLAPRFELLGASYDEGDPQEIVKLEFDAVADGASVAENIWVKLSWLSFDDYDGSLRFRFSFGLENYEDVAADPQRQAYAAELTEALFPESALISGQPRLQAYLQEMLQAETLRYVERIVYFNAPDGGAQFHHDVERGHLGVVFAQLSGRTAWLALSTAQLLDALQGYLAQADAQYALSPLIKSKKQRSALLALASDRTALAEYLNKRDNDPLEQLINRHPPFIRLLIERGHLSILNPGDVILLPQHDAAHCAWHAVYCLGDQPGEALSFAIRHAPAPTD